MRRVRIASIVALLLQIAFPLLVGTASAAAPFTYALVRFDRMAASNGGNVFTSGTICANMTAGNVAGTETTLRVVFPTGYTVSTTASDWAVNTTSNTSWPSGASAWTGIAQPTNAPSGQTVDFVSGNLASSGVYCFNWTNTTTALKTPTTASNSLTGSITTRTGTYPGTADEASSAYATAVIGSSITADQIAVSAVVPPIFSFSLSGNSQPFTVNLDPSNTISTSSLQIQVTTNAASGWVAYVKDLNAKTVSDTSSGNQHGALLSANAGNYKISNNTTNSIGAAAHTAVTGSEDYGFAVTSITPNTGGGGLGTLTANAAYDSTSGTKLGTLNPAFYSPFASSSGTANGDQVNFVERANISVNTPEGSDYSDTLTIVAAGLF